MNNTPKQKLEQKLYDLKMKRSNTLYKQKVIDKTLEKVGIDKDKFDESMEILNKLKPEDRQKLLNEQLQKNYLSYNK